MRNRILKVFTIALLFGGSNNTYANFLRTIEELKKQFEGGRHSFTNTVTRSPGTMIEEYLYWKYFPISPEIYNKFSLIENAKFFTIDEMVAGTLESEAIHLAVPTEKQKEVKKTIDQLIAQKAVFGFDGFMQNGCAAPTPYLLVIHPKSKTVHGIDLNPCIEE